MKILSNQKGQVIAILAIMLLVIIIGVTAFAVDIGKLYVERSKVHTACDAAALAGAKQLYNNPDNRDGATHVALQYAQNNGYPSSQVTVNFPANDQVEVVIESTVEFSFAQVLGFKNSVVRVKAFAQSTTKTVNPFEYALFIEAEGNPPNYYEVRMSGSKNHIKGGVHVNGKFRISGSNNHIDVLEAGHGIRITGCGNHVDEQVPDADYQDMPEIETDGLKDDAKQQNRYYRYDSNTGDWYDKDNNIITTPEFGHFSGDKWQIPASIKDINNGTFYVDGGEIHISGSHVHVEDTVFVATGNIHISGSGIDWEAEGENEVAFVSLSSDDQAIQISGSNSNFDGIFYAPNGGVKFSGSNLHVEGAVYAKTAGPGGKIMSGSSNHIEFDSDNDALTAPMPYAKLIY